MELVELGTILEMTKGKKPVNQSVEEKKAIFLMSILKRLKPA